MASFFIFFILTYSFLVLMALFYIDLKSRILPNKYVVQIFFFGLAMHILTGFYYSSFLDITLASLSGSLLLLAIRHFGNKIYKTETMGMGDVKLIGAAGIWLGTEYIFLAIASGALAGVIHGIIAYNYNKLVLKQHIHFSRLSIPAGPGFIVGIITCAIIKFHTLI